MHAVYMKRKFVHPNIAIAIEKAEKELQRELDKQIAIFDNAVAIVLHRYWGYGKERIKRALMWSLNTDDVSNDKWLSIIALLDKECGISININEHGKKWEDLHFLNGDYVDIDDLTPQAVLLMRREQKDWAGALIVARHLLSMHRSGKFGDIRLMRFYEQIMAVREEFKWNPYQIHKAAVAETGVDIDINSFIKMAKEENE